MTTKNIEINLAHSSNTLGPQLGTYEWSLPYVVVQPNDVLTVSYPENIQINGTLKIVLVGEDYNVLNSSGYPFSNEIVGYRNEQTKYIIVEVYLSTQNTQNVTVSTTTTLNHYAKPQLVYFVMGAVLFSLGTIAIFERKERKFNGKKLGQMITATGFALVVSGWIMFLLEPRMMLLHWGSWATTPLLLQDTPWTIV